MEEYKIPLSGLKEGKHVFEFKVKDKFFEGFEQSEINHGDLNIEVALTKRPHFLILDFSINGHVIASCDRCLDDFELPIAYSGKLYVNNGSDELDDSDEIIDLPLNESDFDISQYIYDYILLSMPIQHVHPEDEDGNTMCNAEMLKSMEDQMVQETEEDKVIDPRWKDLNKLIDND